MTIYKMYRENLLYASNLNINITEYYSLKCQKCSALNPYIKDKVHLSPEKIQRILDLYFKRVDEASILGLVGGDTMVHPRFDDILELVRKRYYSRQAHHIEVYFNTIILPDLRSGRIVDILRKATVSQRKN